MSRIIATLILIFLLFKNATSQNFGQIIFEKLPQNLQLYPRNSENTSLVTVKGYTTDPTILALSIVVNRNGFLFKYQNFSIIGYSNNKGIFEFQTYINSELAEYDFGIYKKTSLTDSTLIVIRINVVSGDAYLVTGQSNSYNGIFNSTGTGLNQLMYQGEYARSFGTFTQPDNFGEYNPADTTWNYSNVGNVVGMWATDLQGLIIEKYKVPICIINGGSGGSGIEYNAIRNSQNPMALNTTYGRLLYKTVKSGLLGHINAYLYRQGENEADGAALIWQSNFETLYANLKQDYPAIKKFYVFQNNLYVFRNYNSGILREHQRQTQVNHSDIRAYATIGTPYFDGIHYGTIGHKQTAREIFQMIEYDFYGQLSDQNAFCPDLKKAFYTPDRTKIILLFDENQDIVYPEPYNNTNILEFLLLNIQSNYTDEGYADRNRIILKVGDTINSTLISYLPPFLEPNSPLHPLYKPFLSNKLGLRALSFANFPVRNGLISPNITFRALDNATSINWQAINGATDYIIERKSEFNTDYQFLKKITTLPNLNQSFIDQSFSPNGLYFYRIRALNNETDSEYSNILEVQKNVTCTKLNALINGNWQDPSIWPCNQLPSENDEVIIDGVTIIMTGNCIAKNIQFINGGKIEFLENANLKLHN